MTVNTRTNINKHRELNIVSKQETEERRRDAERKRARSPRKIYSRIVTLTFSG